MTDYTEELKAAYSALPKPTLEARAKVYKEITGKEHPDLAPVKKANK